MRPRTLAIAVAAPTLATILLLAAAPAEARGGPDDGERDPFRDLRPAPEAPAPATSRVIDEAEPAPAEKEAAGQDDPTLLERLFD